MQPPYPSLLPGYLEVEYKYPSAIRPFLLFFSSPSQTHQLSTDNQIKPNTCLFKYIFIILHQQINQHGSLRHLPSAPRQEGQRVLRCWLRCSEGQRVLRCRLRRSEGQRVLRRGMHGYVNNLPPPTSPSSRHSQFHPSKQLQQILDRNQQLAYTICEHGVSLNFVGCQGLDLDLSLSTDGL